MSSETIPERRFPNLKMPTEIYNPKSGFIPMDADIDLEAVEAGKIITGITAVDASNVNRNEKEELKLEKEELKKQAVTDPLTGCYNRAYLEKFETEQFDPERKSGQVGYTFIDLNDFSYLNNTFGHAFGDMALKEFSKFLRLKFRKEDTVIRYGGDEFLILSRNFKNIDNFEDRICATAQGAVDSTDVWNSIIAEIADDWVRDGKLPPINEKPVANFSVGCAAYSSEDGDLEATRVRADKSMYEHKHATKDGGVTS